MAANLNLALLLGHPIQYKKYLFHYIIKMLKYLKMFLEKTSTINKKYLCNKSLKYNINLYYDISFNLILKTELLVSTIYSVY